MSRKASSQSSTNTQHGVSSGNPGNRQQSQQQPQSSQSQHPESVNPESVPPPPPPPPTQRAYRRVNIETGSEESVTQPGQELPQPPPEYEGSSRRVYNSPIYGERDEFQLRQETFNQAVKNDLDRLGDNLRGYSSSLNTRVNDAFTRMEQVLPEQAAMNNQLRREFQGGIDRLEKNVQSLTAALLSVGKKTTVTQVKQEDDQGENVQVKQEEEEILPVSVPGREKKNKKKNKPWQGDNEPKFRIVKNKKGFKLEPLDDFESVKARVDQKVGTNTRQTNRQVSQVEGSSDSESSSGSSEGSSDSESTMHTVDMTDNDPTKTIVKPKELPSQVISLPDIPAYQRGQDFHIYIQNFENSYCGALSDQEKIYKLVNKLMNVQEIKDFALDKGKGKDWVRFRNKLLRRFGKKTEQVLQEFRRIKRDKDEDMLSYVDKLINKLSEPAAGIAEGPMLSLLWGKLPWADQDEVPLFGPKRVKTIRQFRRKVWEVQNNPLRQKIEDLARSQRYLNEEIHKGRPGRKAEEPKREFKGRGRSQERKQENPQGKNLLATFEDEGENQSEPGVEEDFHAYIFDYATHADKDGNKTGQQKSTDQTTDFSVMASQDSSGFQTKDKVQKRRAPDKPKLDKINEETIDESQVPDSFSSHQGQSRFQGAEQGQQREEGFQANPGLRRSQSDMETDAQQDSSGFRTFADRQVPQPEIDQQIRDLRRQQLGNRSFLIENDAFFDRNGCYDLSLAEDAISQVITLKQLRQWKEMQTRGHTVIYHALEEGPPGQELESFYQQMQEETAIQSDLLRVQQKGEHMTAPVLIEKVQVKAIIDTGAQKTLVSQSFVEAAGLLHKRVQYKYPSSLTGISGGTRVASFLQNIAVGLPELTILANPPIIQGCTFDVLLGQDILLRSLVNCSIHFEDLVLRYTVYKQDQPVEQELPLQLVPKNKSPEALFVSTDGNELEDIYPGIGQIQETYDLVLVDPPYEYPAFHGSSIPYPTLSQGQLAGLRSIFDHVMKKDCVLLLWASGKTLLRALQLLEAWGFKFVNILLVWAKFSKGQGKPKLGLGYWTRNNVELLIMARRGQVSKLKSHQKNVGQYLQTFEDEPGTNQHSSKPLKVYELLAGIFQLDHFRNLELFARQKNSVIQRELFDVYGNEVPGYFQSRSETKGEQGVLTYLEQQEEVSKVAPFIPQVDQKLFWSFIEGLDMPSHYKLDRRVIDVLARNFPVFDCKGQVGRIKNTELRVKVREGASIPASNYIRYDPERTTFVMNTVQQWIEKKYVEKGIVNSAYPIVVVNKKGPSKYRACVNFQPLNEVLVRDPELEIYKGDDAEEIIRQGQNAGVICTLDCKEAHNALSVPEEDRRWLGILTPMGTFRSTVGQFGINPVAKEYIRAMTLSIGWLKVHGVYFYADDIIVFGRDFDHALWLLSQVLQCLGRDGFVVSARKCNLFKTEAEVLGQLVGNGKVQIVKDRVQAIQGMEVPKTKKSLQRFIGCLTYLRKFLPNLASLLVPLYDALKGPDFLQLSELQVSVFQKLKDLLGSSTVLKLPESGKPFYITISFNRAGYGAALFQKENKTFKPIFYRSKTLQGRTIKPWAVQQLRALLQACKDWHLVIYNQPIKVLTDSPLLKRALNFNGDDVEVNELLLKLGTYRLEVEVKPDSFRALRISQVLADEQSSKAQHQLEELLEQHLESRVEVSTDPIPPPIQTIHFYPYKYNVYFDGACSRSKCQMPLGAYGFAVFNSEGRLVHQESGQVTSPDRITNNLAESFAALRAVEFVVSQRPNRFEKIQIIGDSELVIRQLKRQYRVNNDSLRVYYRQIKEQLKPYKEVRLVNVPRIQNQVANDLAQECLKGLIRANLESQVLLVHIPDEQDDIYCVLCGKKGAEEDVVLCDNCGAGQHRDCLGELMHPTGGAFYCKDCEAYVYLEPTDDITQDHMFLEFLEGLQVPRSDQARCEQLAKFYSLRDGDLYYHDRQEVKKVPSLSDRHLVTLQVHQGLGHPGVSSTLRSVRLHYFWPGMAKDVKQLVQSCHFCQARRHKYLPMPQVFPTYKGLAPFQYVSADLIVVQTPSGEEKYVLSVICAYSKWPELVVLRSRSSQDVTQAFTDHVVCRYGPPLVVRCDDGKEFLGEFKEYLAINKIRQITAGPRYPQGNGLVERLNQVIKQKLQSLNNSEELKDHWATLVQTIAFAIRISQSRATGFSPYQILYGRDPLLPGHFTPLPGDTFYEPTLQSITATLERLRRTYEQQSKFVKAELADMNKEIKRTVEAREFKQVTNLQFGQQIFVRNKDKPTKLDLEVEGPCYFLRYLDQHRRDMIVYFNPRTRRYLTANIANVKLAGVQ